MILTTKANSLEHIHRPKNIQLQTIRIPIRRISFDSSGNSHKSFEMKPQQMVMQTQYQRCSPARDISAERRQVRIVMPCTVIPTRGLVIQRHLSDSRRPKGITIFDEMRRQDEPIIADTPIRQLDKLMEEVPKQRPKELYNRLLEKRRNIHMHEPLPTPGFFRK